MTPANRNRAEPSVLAAIHHPLRRRLIDLLHIDGPATASGDPAAELVAATAEDANLAHHVGKVRQWFDMRYEYDEPWVRAAYATERWLTLTPAQLEELSERLEELLGEYHDKPTDGDDAHKVFFFAHAVPARP
jgi:hypothetical protein